ncbi:hypothetical protein SRHO_G00060040 [Serrasalmus rhombeus]
MSMLPYVRYLIRAGRNRARKEAEKAPLNSLFPLKKRHGLEMESAIKTVVTQFITSARGKDSLGAKNFQKLVQSQLGNIMSDTDSSSAVKEMMHGLDDNQDGKVSFQEYMNLVGYLATSLSERKTGTQNSAAN